MSQGPTGPTEHPMTAAMALIEAGLDALLGGDCWSLTDDGLCELLDRIAAAQARLAAGKLAAIAEVDARGFGAAEATSTSGWLRAVLLMSPGDARQAVTLAAALRADCAATGTVLAAGRLGLEQARVITETITALPPVEPATKEAAEAFLIGQAAVLDPVELRRAGRHLIETLTMTPDADERVLRQQQARELHLVQAADGMTLVRGQLDPESAAVLHAALDPLSAPEPAADGTPDPRSAAQRRADGLAGMAHRCLAAGGLPASGGMTPAMTVTIDHAGLCGTLRAAGLLNDGQALSAAAARRLACDAKITPVVLGGSAQPLDVGRTRRTIPQPIRAALITRDQACAFPTCDRPAAWTAGHHIRHWADGGPTALHNLVLLCLTHHQAIHHAGWQVALDTDGLPYFTAPPWIDPDQSPRQHHRYRLRRLRYDTDRSPPDRDCADAVVPAAGTCDAR